MSVARRKLTLRIVNVLFHIFVVFAVIFIEAVYDYKLDTLGHRVGDGALI